jgi:hypothetical protein
MMMGSVQKHAKWPGRRGQSVRMPLGSGSTWQDWLLVVQTVEILEAANKKNV